MLSSRSRQGCEECRRRRRKCDEQKPSCRQCSIYRRNCSYPLRLIWGAGRKRSSQGEAAPYVNEPIEPSDQDKHPGHQDRRPLEATASETSCVTLNSVSQYLPNGRPLPPKYRKLLNYFTDEILPSLSCHPSIHQDLGGGLVPVMLNSPGLLSSCLALSAAGCLSRGVLEVEGQTTMEILWFLQTSGLRLLRGALESEQRSEILLATCLIWCLTDVFTYRQGISSWRIHLNGIKALLDKSEAYRDFSNPCNPLQTAMRHLFQLYLSLQTLPYIRSMESTQAAKQLEIRSPSLSSRWTTPASAEIDGFLGYSNELLIVLEQIDALSSSSPGQSRDSLPEADMLLGKVRGMISRDASVTPQVSICPPLTPEYNREFLLCHMTFQQATLIHLYRRLYNLPSGSVLVQNAVRDIEGMVDNMIQGHPCHTWVAMAMPLFTIGCEAFTQAQQDFAMDKVHKLDACIGSLHVRGIKKALEEMWELRRKSGDFDGRLCSSELLDKLQYSIILF